MPIYGRSADNLRDHRHVTSLLHRAYACEDGVVVKPTLSFDERGHQKNDTAYFVLGADENGAKPEEIIADADLYVGEGGTYLRPASLLKNRKDAESWKKAPFEVSIFSIVAGRSSRFSTLRYGILYASAIFEKSGLHIGVNDCFLLKNISCHWRTLPR